MKSLLVDALREANGSLPAAAETRPVVEEPVARAPHDEQQRRVTDQELSIADDDASRESMQAALAADTIAPRAPNLSADPAPMADTVPSAIIAPATEPPTSEADSDIEATDHSAADIECRTEDDAARHEPSVVDPALVLPSLDPAGLELADDDAREPEPTPEVHDVSPAAARATPPDGAGLVALARWSPVLCFLTLSAAAGSLVMYQNLTAQHPGNNLSASATLPAIDSSDIAVTPVWQSIAESTGIPTNERPEGSKQPTVADSTQASQRERDPRRAGRLALQADTRVGDELVAADDPHFENVSLAYHAYREGRYEVAERVYRDILSDDSHHVHALTGLAAVLQRGSRAIDAVELYERLLMIDPRDTVAAASLAAMADAGISQSVETRLKILLQQQPTNAALHFALGLRMARQDRWPEAFDMFQRAERLDPRNADYGYNAAVSALQLGRPDVARALYAKALVEIDANSIVDRDTVQRQLERLGTADGGRP